MPNVLELKEVRLETVVYRKTNDKDRMFVDFCKAKRSIFPEEIAFEKSLMSAHNRPRVPRVGG